MEADVTETGARCSPAGDAAGWPHTKQINCASSIARRRGDVPRQMY